MGSGGEGGSGPWTSSAAEGWEQGTRAQAWRQMGSGGSWSRRAGLCSEHPLVELVLMAGECCCVYLLGFSARAVLWAQAASLLQ